MSDINLILDGSIRLYSYPKHYSVVWNGTIDVDNLHAEERKLFNQYSKTLGMNALNERDVVYLTPEEKVEFHINSDLNQNINHSIFINYHSDDIAFARIDNEIFALWADIWGNNGYNEKSEVGIKLQFPPIPGILKILRDTIRGEKQLTENQDKKILNQIKEKLGGRYKSGKKSV